MGHGRLFGHSATESSILEAMETSGYRLVEKPEAEPESSFLIFAQA